LKASGTKEMLLLTIVVIARSAKIFATRQATKIIRQRMNIMAKFDTTAE
jgi:hypothetical protein